MSSEWKTRKVEQKKNCDEVCFIFDLVFGVIFKNRRQNLRESGPRCRRLLQRHFRQIGPDGDDCRVARPDARRQAAGAIRVAGKSRLRQHGQAGSEDVPLLLLLAVLPRERPNGVRSAVQTVVPQFQELLLQTFQSIQSKVAQVL